MARELGQLLALHLQNATMDAKVIGFTSWSRALGETVRYLQPLPHSGVKQVVEMVGDLGPPTLQHLAAQNTQQLATLTGADPLFLRVPGVLPNREVKQIVLEHNRHARAALSKLDHMDFAMTGSVRPVSLLRSAPVTISSPRRGSRGPRSRARSAN